MNSIGVGIQILLDTPDSFLLAKETLTRIGVSSKKDKKLYQSCHILHKRGNYFLTHFKELFILDGRPSSISEEDLKRRNAIAKLLHEWGLVTVVDLKDIENCADIRTIKVLTFKDKHEWELISKYTIGNNHKEK